MSSNNKPTSNPPPPPPPSTTPTMSLPQPRPQREIRAHQPTPETIVVYQAYSRTIAGPAVENQRLDASPAFSLGRMTWAKPSWAWMMYRCGYGEKDRGQEVVLGLTMRTKDFWGLLRTTGGVEKGESATKEARGESARGEGSGGSVGGEGIAARDDGDDVAIEPEQQDKVGLTGSTSELQPTATTTDEVPRKSRGKNWGQGKAKGRRTAADIEKAHKSTTVRIQWDPERSYSLEKLSYRSVQIGIPGGLCKEWTRGWIVGIEDVTERARKLKEVVVAEPGITDEEILRRGLVPVETVVEVPPEVRGILGMD